jgi:hypothetical protein
MKGAPVRVVFLTVLTLAAASAAAAYTLNYAVPSAGGCPVPTRFSTLTPVARRWSTSLASTPQTVFTVAAPGTSQQIAEIQQAISDAFSAWTGVSGTRLNASEYPNALAPLSTTPTQNACGDSQGSSVTGENTICFNQSSTAFTPGVLAFTRVFVATAPGQTIGTVTSSFTGQILEADILFRNDGQATFAAPGALASEPNAYDLESILIHELGHFFGLEHSPIWRSVLSPFAPPPGTYWGPRPSAAAPDGPLREDDRTGIRVLYPDPNDMTDVGVITGRVLSANPLALSGLGATAAGEYVTGIFGAAVVAVDADTGEVVAGALSGWSCPSPNSAPVFDGSYTIARLPLGRSYNLYIEPLNGAFVPSDVGGNGLDVCSTDNTTPCSVPPVNTDFVAHVRSSG